MCCNASVTCCNASVTLCEALAYSLDDRSAHNVALLRCSATRLTTAWHKQVIDQSTSCFRLAQQHIGAGRTDQACEEYARAAAADASNPSNACKVSQQQQVLPQVQSYHSPTTVLPQVQSPLGQQPTTGPPPQNANRAQGEGHASEMIPSSRCS